MGHEVGNDPIYVFGPFTLDARKHKLTRKGKRVDLDVKPTQVLLALVEQAGKLVSKEDLLKQVWGGIAVSDDSFYQHASVLRKTLRQRPKDNKYIMTIPGAGYKFVAPVKIVDRIEDAGPVEKVAPVEIAAPVETVAQVEIAAPVETVVPVEIAAPVETVAPVEMAAPVETAVPVEIAAPVETVAQVEMAAPVETAVPVEIAAPVETVAPVEIGAPVGTVVPVETVAPVEQCQDNVEPDWVIDAVIEMLEGNSNTDEEKGTVTVGPDEDNRIMDDAERDRQNSQLEERLNREEDAARKVGMRQANEVHYHPEMDDDDQEDYESVDI